MASFTVEFQREILFGPEYENYSIDQVTECNDDAQQRRVRFNDIVNGDFVVGYNYTSSTSSPAQIIRIESYTDEMISTEISSGIVAVPAGFVPSQLERISTNTTLTYPYSMNISELSDIGIEANSVELMCEDRIKYTASRIRSINYYIFDSNGQSGPLRTARFTNSQS